FFRPASSIRWVNPISRADRHSDRMSKPFRIWFSIFVVATGVLSAVIGKSDGCVYRFPLHGKASLQVFDLITHLPSRLNTMNWISTAILVEPAEDPDEKDDRDGYTDQPQQKTSTQAVSSDSLVAQTNVASSQRRI